MASGVVSAHSETVAAITSRQLLPKQAARAPGHNTEVSLSAARFQTCTKLLLDAGDANQGSAEWPDCLRISALLHLTHGDVARNDQASNFLGITYVRESG